MKKMQRSAWNTCKFLLGVPDSRGKEKSPISSNDTEDKNKRLQELYGKEMVESSMREKIRRRQVILRPDQFDDDAVISALEKSVAYNRERSAVDAILSIKSNAPAANLTPATPVADNKDGNSNTKINFMD